MEHAAVGLSEFLLGTLSIAFGAWSLAIKGARGDLKEMSAQFMGALADLTKEISRLREDINNIANRVTRAEADISHLQIHDRDRRP